MSDKSAQSYGFVNKPSSEYSITNLAKLFSVFRQTVCRTLDRTANEEESPTSGSRSRRPVSAEGPLTGRSGDEAREGHVY